MRKTTLIPPFLMLAAGAITMISAVMKKLSLNNMLLRTLIVMFVFCIIGYIVKMILDKFAVVKEDTVSDEGEVIEKEAEEEKAEDSQTEKSKS